MCTCSYCGKLIEGEYLKIGDNFLLVHYFDSEQDNIFCCEHCIACALSVLEVDLNGNEYPIV